MVAFTACQAKGERGLERDPITQSKRSILDGLFRKIPRIEEVLSIPVVANMVKGSLTHRKHSIET